MVTRESDTHEGDMVLPKITVTRGLPLWSIVTFIVVVIGQAISLKYDVLSIQREQVSQAAQQKVTADDVKDIKKDLVNTSKQTYETGYQLGDLNRRVLVLEAQQGKGRQ